MKRYYHPSYSSFFITENGDIYNAGGTGKKIKGSIVNGYKRISMTKRRKPNQYSSACVYLGSF